MANVLNCTIQVWHICVRYEVYYFMCSVCSNCNENSHQTFHHLEPLKSGEDVEVAFLPASSILKKYITVTSKRLLINYTSTSGSSNFGMIIVDYFLVAPEFIQLCIKYVSRFCMHNTIRQIVPHIDNC